MIDCSKIGEVAARTMEEIGDAYDDGRHTVRTVAIVVELDREDAVGLVVRSSEDRRWALTAFLFTAAEWMDEQGKTSEDDGE